MSIDSATLVNFCKRKPLIIFCVLVSLGLFGWMRARGETIAEVQQELQARNVDLAKHRANVSNFSQLEAQLAQIKELNERVARRSASMSQQAENQRYFYKLEAETGVRFELQPAAPVRPAGKPAAKTKPTYGEVGFLVVAKGSYTDVITVLRRFESAPILTRVNSVSASFSGESINLNVNLSLLGVP